MRFVGRDVSEPRRALERAPVIRARHLREPVAVDDEAGACEVRPGTLNDVDAAAAVLAQAFADSPWTCWTVDPERHVERIGSLQQLVMERAVLAFGELWVACVGTEVVGAAMWMHPDRVPHPAVWSSMSAETAALEGSRHDVSVMAEEMLAFLKPAARHYYVGAVGVAPGWQGRGIGAELLTPVLHRADDESADVYLETSTEWNVAFYAALGFVVSGEHQIPDGGPHVWAMSRPPNPAVRS